jgi:cytochrome c oxidase accessory protein FixG
MPGKEAGAFRDKIETMTEKGQRKWIYANPPKGSLHRYRVMLAFFLLAVFFAGPFLRIEGEPLLLLNILDRRFVLFGQIFWPQDFHLFVIMMITFIIAIVLFTVIYGRVWCGWSCPQTIFMEMVFRKIEFLIEGNATAQKRLNKNKSSIEYIWKKGLKHLLFIIVSIVISHTFLAYLVGVDRVQELIMEGPGQNMSSFTAMVIFTVVFYGVFSQFREQVCSLVCPYGRFQGALLDKNTLMVSYDYLRGEPRGPIRKSEVRWDAGKGDCINCNSCVSVCPTGLDIRNGMQLECINCTSCLDACNGVMKKVGFKPGLIRIASAESIRTGQKFRFTGRMAAYTALLGVLISLIFALFALRTDFESTILRVRGTLFQDQGNGQVSNLFNYKVVNKTNRDILVDFRLIADNGELKIVGNVPVLKGQSKIEGVLMLLFDKEELPSSELPVSMGVYANGELVEVVSTTFLGPSVTN